MSKPNKKRKTDWKRVALIVTSVILSVVLLLLAAVGMALNYLDKKLDKMNYITGHATVSPEAASSMAMDEWLTMDPSDTTPFVNIDDITFPTEVTMPAGQGDHIVNILLVGQDAREGQGTQRSDSMILMTFNKATGGVTLTSFMRDQFVQIPGYGSTKLCHAYQYGGMDLLNQTLFNHFGVEVHGNVEVNFSGFAKIIDLLGGVEITLTQKEADKLNEQEGWNLQPGFQRLDGKEALRYSRLRQIDSDFKRAERQRKVLLSLIDAYKNQSLPEMLALLDDILPLITTNISKQQIRNYMIELFPMLAKVKVGSMRIPASGTFESGLVNISEGYMASCQYNIDFAANRKILDELFDKIP
jgi:LCP family protein required for cell wall assembly